MIPMADPLGAAIGLLLALGAILFVLLDLVLLAGLLWRRVSPTPAAIVAAVPLFAYALFVIRRLSVGDLLEPGLAAFLFSPAIAGLVVLVAALMRARTRLTLSLAVGALTACAVSAVLGRHLVQRVGLYQASLTEDVGAARRLIAAGAASRRYERALRQQAFVNAARDVNPEIVAAFLDAGVDPNEPFDERTALAGALGSDAILRYPPIDPGTHPKRRLDTVRVLLDHGADPNGRGEVTPVEIAWFGGLSDEFALLEAHGARDAETVPTNWTELLRACAEGDAARVKRLAGQHGGSRQKDAQGRAPLVIAAENGRLDVVNVLLDAYGGFVKCELAAAAQHAALEQQHGDVASRLGRVCADPAAR